MNQTPDFFDQLARSFATNEPAPLNTAAHAIDLDEDEGTAPPQADALRTPTGLRQAVQHLLANGWLEAVGRPRMFRLIAEQTARLDLLLEPLDLQVRVDDVRGLAFLAVLPDDDAEQADAQVDDGWTHPLMRRQRLTLEQSLLLAILRREFLQREQEAGIGSPVRVAFASLLLQIGSYLGETGSDLQERKRLGQLLDNLRTHGMVSEIDEQGWLLIKPMIVHLLNPENLQALLQSLREMRTASAGADDGSGGHIA